MRTSEIITGIARCKEAAGLTNQQLADASGVPKATVDRILSGRTENPTIQTILDLANAVGYEFSALPETPAVSIPAESGSAALVALYEKRIEGYERLIARDERNHNRLLAEKNRWLKFSLILNIILVTAIIGVLIYDITHLDVGWVRDQVAAWGGIRDFAESFMVSIGL